MQKKSSSSSFERVSVSVELKAGISFPFYVLVNEKKVPIRQYYFKEDCLVEDIMQTGCRRCRSLTQRATMNLRR